jgi:hypothetical protein
VIRVENHQIIYLQRRFVETTISEANYWNKPYSPASYFADLNTDFGNLRHYLNRCLYKKAKQRFQELTLQPSNIVFSKHLTTLPKSAGVYALFSKDKECLYVGASKNIRKRVPVHKGWGSNVRFDEVFFIAYWLTEQNECWDLEKVILVSLHPSQNSQYRYDILPKWCQPLTSWKHSLWPVLKHG